MLWASVGIFDILGIVFHEVALLRGSYRVNAVFAIPMSVAAFGYFVTMPNFYNKYINIIASSVLGVYLIHENAFMRMIIWHHIFPNSEWVASSWYPFFFLVKVLSIFAIFCAIELVRKWLLDGLFSNIAERILISTSNRWNRMFNH